MFAKSTILLFFATETAATTAREHMAMVAKCFCQSLSQNYTSMLIS